jgi:hypothetical protein
MGEKMKEEIKMTLQHQRSMTNKHSVVSLPYRGDGSDRPRHIPLPPQSLPLLWQWRLRKQWRYISFWSSEFLICVAGIEVGPVRQEFWGVWDRQGKQLWEKTRLYPKAVKMRPNGVQVQEKEVAIDLDFTENSGFEVVTPVGHAYTWTRKQLLPTTGTVRLGGKTHTLNGTMLIDDNAGYHPRHTRWQWSGGAGKATTGEEIGWIVIVGLNDDPQVSEQTVWVNGVPRQVGPVQFADDLSSLSFSEGTHLTFTQEAVRQRNDNLLLVRSAYAQPFGSFHGTLPGGLEIAEAYGVMEWHDAVW